jgi:mycothiol synthase
LSIQANIQLRNFKWSDLDALQQLLNEIGQHGHRDWPALPNDLRSELEFPDVNPKRNIALAEHEGQIVGYAFVKPEANIGRSVIGIGNSSMGMAIRKNLIDWAINNAAQAAPIAHLSTRDNENELEKLVNQLGWSKVRRYLKLTTSSNISLATAAVPDGFTVRTMLGLDEVPELTYIQNEAFKEHFGYSPNAEDEIIAHLLAGNSSPDNIVMIHDVHEQLVAYCWTFIYERDGLKIGRIGMMGVLPTTRKKGLGRAIAEAGFNHLVRQKVSSIELDVDSENAPAIHVYSSLGFNEDSEVSWWERAL